MKVLSNTNIDFRSYLSEKELNKEFVKIIINKINHFLKTRKSINLVLPGGNSIKNFYKLFFNSSLLWKKINISVTDERWVDRTHYDSNEKTIIENMGINNIDFNIFHSLKGNHSEIKDAILSNNMYLKNMLPISILVLGMGDDGHTASLFKDDVNLANLMSKSNLNITDIANNEDYKRITYTKNALSTAENTYLYIRGKKKLKVLEKALSTEDETIFPIFAFLDKPISVFWSK